MAAQRKITPGGEALAAVSGTVRKSLDDAREIAVETPGIVQDYVGLWGELLKISTGNSEVAPEKGDARFADPAFQDNPAYKMVAQTYLASSRAMEALGDRLEAKGSRSAPAVKFATGIVTSALAPTNYLLGNPAALKRAFATGGGSLVRGMRNWANDQLNNGGMPAMAKPGAFTVGADMAVTPGAVVARDDVGEVLQYTPTTPQVYERPTLVIPPPIGRYYFLDIGKQRSFVEYAVSQGLQMFLLSWRNPEKEHAAWGVDEYAGRVIKAVDEIRAITGSADVNLIGFCAGGIVESIAVNKLMAEGDTRVHSCSFAVTLLDWGGNNPMNAFESPATIEFAKNKSKRAGVFDSKAMGSAFTWLRPNDLVWNYWVNNYLMGQDPPAFDILAWNADGTRLPAKLHGQFLDIFHKNALAQTEAREYLGTPYDAHRITCPVFVQGAVNDHLTPWKGTYRTTQLVGSDDVTYVLSNAGHIASLVNPPSNPKASYFVGGQAGEVDAEAWQAGATKKTGTWWTEWCQWASERSGAKKDAPTELGPPNLGAAPGLYVRDRVPPAPKKKG